MKEKIKRLLESEKATLRINDFFVLKRWTKDALNNDVDVLRLYCSINYYNCDWVDIKSRKLNTMTEDIISAMKIMNERALKEMIKDFENGYIIER